MGAGPLCCAGGEEALGNSKIQSRLTGPVAHLGSDRSTARLLLHPGRQTRVLRWAARLVLCLPADAGGDDACAPAHRTQAASSDRLGSLGRAAGGWLAWLGFARRSFCRVILPILVVVVFGQ